jgi:hypothetical protein
VKQNCGRFETYSMTLLAGDTMKIRSFVARAALALTVAVAGSLASASVTSLTLAQGDKTGQPNVSPEEQNLLKGITTAPDEAAKLKAAEALIKKYPKSVARPRVARSLADEIAGVKDATQKIALAQEYQGAFKEPSEQQMIVQILIEAFAGANRFDEAFSSGAEFLKQSPDSLQVLVQLLSIGTDQAKQRNPKFIPQSLQYGTHAIELIETDKKPADMDDATWNNYKTIILPSLYQSMGIMNIVKGDRAEAKARLGKAATISPTDPFNYLLLTGILNDEYQEKGLHYKAMPDGPAKDAELKTVLAFLDQVIDAYAHTIALAEGNERLQPMRQQYLQDLEAYYKYRHKNSTEGMQQLIDKYKVPAKQ